MTMKPLVCVLLLAALVVACSGDGQRRSSTALEEPPQLLVAIVYDQVPAWAYARYRDLLSPEGAIHRMRSSGAEHTVEYAHAGTHTAPGHAAIFTGAASAESGVSANNVWTDARGLRPVVDDGVHQVFGLEDAYASPTVVRVDSVADALRAAHGDTARIVSLSIKGRGAVLTAGRDPDLALWYETRLGAITSSTYYADRLPDWVTSWVEAHPIENYFTDWEARDPKMLQSLLGPDDGPGEGDYRGLGRTFPHNAGASTAPERTFRATPQSTEYLLELARESVAELKLGADDVPDLLVLSISGTDYVGHVFGTESWEYLDNLIRVDEAVGRFLTELDRTTRVATLLTSDHGVARLPERAAPDHPTPVRIYPDLLKQEINEALVGVFGAGDWVGYYEPPFLYLTAAALADGRREEAIAAALSALQTQPGVHAAYDLPTAAGWRDSPDPVRRAVAAGIPDPEVGAVFLVYQPGSIHDEGFERGKGTAHGTPWDYDRQIPALFAGPGVTRTASTEPLEQSRVAATLCRLLGIAPPSHLRNVEPLPGS